MKSKAEGGGMKDENVVISIEWIKHALILAAFILAFLRCGLKQHKNLRLCRD